MTGYFKIIHRHFSKYVHNFKCFIAVPLKLPNIPFAWFYSYASSLEVLALYILIKKHFIILEWFT